MNVNGTVGRRDVRRAPLRDERGMLLVMTMLILLVVSTLAATNLVNAFLERSIAKNQNYASIALNAADGGLNAALAWLNDPANANSLPGAAGNNPPTPADPWLQSYLQPPLASTINRTAGSALGPLFTQGEHGATYNATYEVTMSLLTDDEDRDLDGDTTEIVLFNRPKATQPVAAGNHGRFGYESSFYMNPNEGLPVIKVVSVGSYGAAGRRELVLELGNNKMNIQANGAVTAMGNVSTTGNITVDGTSHDANGNPGGSCNTAFTGVNVPAPVDLNADGDFNDPGESSYGVSSTGSSSTAGTPAGTGSTSNVSYSPDQAVGVCDGNGDGDCDDAGELENTGGPIDEMLGGLPAANAPDDYGCGVGCKKSGNIYYVNNSGNYDFTDISGGSAATGVLIVHNPRFDPRVWRCSIPVVPNPALPNNASAQIVNPDLTAPPAGTSNVCFIWNGVSHDTPYYDGALNADYQVNNFAHQQTGAHAGPRRPRNLTGNGDFTFRGAVIADQINPINGNITIIGAVISLSGVSIDVLGSGSAAVLYSCDALNLFTAQGYSTKLGWRRVY